MNHISLSTIQQILTLVLFGVVFLFILGCGTTGTSNNQDPQQVLGAVELGDGDTCMFPVAFTMKNGDPLNFDLLEREGTYSVSFEYPKDILEMTQQYTTVAVFQRKNQKNDPATVTLVLKNRQTGKSTKSNPIIIPRCEKFELKKDEPIPMLTGPGDCVMLYHQKHSKDSEKRLTKYYYYNLCERKVRCKMTATDTYDVNGEKQAVTDEIEFEINPTTIQRVETSITISDHPGNWLRYTSTDFPVSHPVDQNYNFGSLRAQKGGKLILDYMNMVWDEQELTEEERMTVSNYEFIQKAFISNVQNKLMPCEWAE